MSESKGKILFVILAVLLLLFGGGTMLYPALNGLLVERTMHRDSEDFLLLLEEDAERTAEENSHVIPGDPGTRETAEPQLPLEHTQLWLDMKAYNEAIFREGQKGLADPPAYEDACFRLSDYGLDNEARKRMSEKGFETHRLTKPELKRFLAIYLEASMDGDKLPDMDGSQYIREALKKDEKKRGA